MPPWGGREALFGTSPFAAGAPGGYVLDMSPAVAARGKIRRAARRGEKIPEGYALDKDGRSTTDPNAALEGGVVLPIGGPKGSAISMLMGILGGVISRSEEHTSELQSLMRNSYAVYCLKKKTKHLLI